MLLYLTLLVLAMHEQFTTNLAKSVVFCFHMAWAWATSLYLCLDVLPLLLIVFVMANELVANLGVQLSLLVHTRDLQCRRADIRRAHKKY